MMNRTHWKEPYVPTMFDALYEVSKRYNTSLEIDMKDLCETLFKGDYISARCYHCLINERPYGLATVRDLAKMSEAHLRRIPNLGRVTAAEIREILANLGLHFGMNLEE